MNSLNSVIIEGNLVRDPVFKTTSKGTALCTFSIASNRSFKKESGVEKETSYFDIQTWSKLAESCYNLGQKGRGVKVVGRLKQDRWNDPEGKPRSKVIIVAEQVDFRPDFRRDSPAETMDDETSEGQEIREPALELEPTL
jgi:single-strand DNA-binding protein